MLLKISGFYLMYVQANLPETSPFLSAQMAVLSSFHPSFKNVYSTWDIYLEDAISSLSP